MDEDFSNRVDKLESEVKENRTTMHSVQEDVNAMHRSLQEQTMLIEKLMGQQGLERQRTRKSDVNLPQKMRLSDKDLE